MVDGILRRVLDPYSHHVLQQSRTMSLWTRQTYLFGPHIGWLGGYDF